MTTDLEQGSTDKGLIYKKIALIMAEVGSIGKTNRNKQQGYSFRGIDDVYASLQKLMAKHGVFSVPYVVSDNSEERKSKNGATLIYRILTIMYTFYAEDGSNVTSQVIGEGMDSGDKASNKAMAVADKYACCQVFKIPTSEPKDPEVDSHDVEPNPVAPAKPEPYEGRPDQKKLLADVFAAYQINDADTRKELNQKAIDDPKVMATPNDLTKFVDKTYIPFGG